MACFYNSISEQINKFLPALISLKLKSIL